jgi:hypothetical protein
LTGGLRSESSGGAKREARPLTFLHAWHARKPRLRKTVMDGSKVSKAQVAMPPDQLERQRKERSRVLTSLKQSEHRRRSSHHCIPFKVLKKGPCGWTLAVGDCITRAQRTGRKEEEFRPTEREEGTYGRASRLVDCLCSLRKTFPTLRNELDCTRSSGWI